MRDTHAPQPQRPAIEQAIRDFKFWNYGLDAADPNSEYAEWVPDLAKAIVAALGKEHLRKQLALAAPKARLHCIAQAHAKEVLEGGLTSGCCVECGHAWPCPTFVWASTERDPLATWDPADDEQPEETR